MCVLYVNVLDLPLSAFMLEIDIQKSYTMLFLAFIEYISHISSFYGANLAENTDPHGAVNNAGD